MGDELEERKASARLAESLGWLAESSLQPKKRNRIEGVSGGTLVDLKAQLYRTQEETKLKKEAGEDGGHQQARKRLRGEDPEASKKNSGVEERDVKDKLSIKNEADKADACYVALEKKAALYNKIVQGDMSDEEEQYEVNFFHKKYMQPTATETNDRRPSETPVDLSSAVAAKDEHLEEIDRQHRKELILEQAELTKEGRERAARVKSRRESSIHAKREELKATFLKKQLKKIREANKSSHTKDSQP